MTSQPQFDLGLESSAGYPSLFVDAIVDYLLEEKTSDDWRNSLKNALSTEQNAHSDESGRRNSTTEQLSRELAHKFAKRCFTPIELLSFQHVFRSLDDREGSMGYLKEDTIARFLELPEALEVSSIVFQMMSYLGAFPFAQDAPVVLGFEQMIMVVTILTERYKAELKKGSKDRTRLLFRSLAVADGQNVRTQVPKKQPTDDVKPTVGGLASQVAGLAVDQPANNDEAIVDDDDDEGPDADDELAVAALESLDAIDVYRHGATPISQASIPTDNLRKVIMLLLLVAPLEGQESLAVQAKKVIGDDLDGLRNTADHILSAFVGLEKSPGIKFSSFENIISASLPYLFNGLNALFEHFLFSKAIDHTRRMSIIRTGDEEPEKPPPPQQPLLAREGEILDLAVLSQLSFFIPATSLFRQLRLLYSGGEAGFSIGSFESKVFHWRAPTILLVSGKRIPEHSARLQERAFTESLPKKRLPDSDKSQHLVFGAYVNQPWKQTFKDCMGDSETILFQLEPVHEVFKASSVNTDYVSFTKLPTSHPGIGIGNPHPKTKQTLSQAAPLLLGDVSLLLDGSFEFGVFTHDHSRGGGAFRHSTSRRRDWQDRFEIESLEVWGCGGDKEAELQRQRWAWEEREAKARRQSNLGTGDIEADRALLEMAGIIGANQSGGST